MGSSFRLTNKTDTALVRGQYGCNTGYWTSEPPTRVEPNDTISWSADVGDFGDPDGFVNYYIDGQPNQWVLVWWKGPGASAVAKSQGDSASAGPALVPTPAQWSRVNPDDVFELSVIEAPIPALTPIFHAPGEKNVVQTYAFRGSRDRFYFASGAAHDPDNTGYIGKILKALDDAGIKDPKDVYAHGTKTTDLLFTTGRNSWLAADKIFDDVPTKWDMDEFGVRTPIAFKQVPVPVDWRITKAVDLISSDLSIRPLTGSDQFNLAGYSTGSVIMAQAALKLARSSTAIDFLILIGCPVSTNSSLFHDLSSNPNIRHIIRVDIPGDDVATLNTGPDGMASPSNTIVALISFTWDGDDHPHFKYAFNKNADADRAQLAQDLVNAGVR